MNHLKSVFEDQIHVLKIYSRQKSNKYCSLAIYNIIFLKYVDALENLSGVIYMSNLELILCCQSNKRGIINHVAHLKMSLIWICLQLFCFIGSQFQLKNNFFETVCVCFLCMWKCFLCVEKNWIYKWTGTTFLIGYDGAYPTGIRWRQLFIFNCTCPTASNFWQMKILPILILYITDWILIWSFCLS